MITPERANVDENRDALAALFHCQFDDVYRFCLARSGDRSIADDIAAETFLAASKQFAAGRADEVTRPWLFVVARRKLIDKWRRDERNRKRHLQLLAARRSTSEASAGPDVGVAGADEIIKALSSLPARQRTAITLRYLDEYSVSEIAETLEVGYRAAESLLARGRAGFKAAWESR